MDINGKSRRAARFNRCHCGATKVSWHVACPPCWAKVPKDLQVEIYRLRKERRHSPDHREAVRKAMVLMTGQSQLAL